MSYAQRYSLLLATLLIIPPAFAYEVTEVSDEARDCYSKAMIGYDSVINSRLGIPAEHALPLTRLPTSALSESLYRDELLVVMWGAYLWNGSPHSYAIKTFFDCARNSDSLSSAGIQQLDAIAPNMH